jgi:hypothetical protein
MSGILRKRRLEGNPPRTLTKKAACPGEDVAPDFSFRGPLDERRPGAMLSGGAATRVHYARLKHENLSGPSPRGCFREAWPVATPARAIHRRRAGSSLFLELFLGLARARAASGG